MIIESLDDVVFLSGSLCTNQWPAVLATANLVYERHPLGVVIDCSGLSFVSAAGAQTFADAQLHIEQEEAAFMLACLPSNVQQRRHNANDLHLRLKSQWGNWRIHQAIWSSTWWERLWGGGDST